MDSTAMSKEEYQKIANGIMDGWIGCLIDEGDHADIVDDIARALLAASRDTLEAAATVCMTLTVNGRRPTLLECASQLRWMAEGRAAMPSPADTDGREGGEG